MAEQEKEPFVFNISLSVLNHLGRNLYRNFITVLGEAISNSWDAEAENVYIKIDKDGKYFSIRDDGIGMDDSDFRRKFLKIGYSKRNHDGPLSPNKKRPYIGRKGIGKLALLSCADRIHIASKKSNTDYIGGIIDNTELDDQIEQEALNEETEDDLQVSKYTLTAPDEDILANLKQNHDKGTIIYFENVHEGISNEIKTLRRLIALYFRFSLIDPSFSIFVNNKEVDSSDLDKLSDKTQFLWTINEFLDPFFETLKHKKEPLEPMSINNKNIKGFIASVEKPSHLNIFGAGEKIGVDVFVNGRLRETNILKHRPTFASRVVASYLYGQIHLNALDDANSDNNNDKFTTSREGIKLDDKMYQGFLKAMEEDVFNPLSTQWDKWRIKHRQDGDPEEKNLSTYIRKLGESSNHRKKDFENRINKLENIDNNMKIILNKALLELSFDNTKIYQDLFILENLFRVFLEQSGVCDIDKLDTVFLNDPEIKGKDGYMKKLTRIKNIRKSQEEDHELEGKIVKKDYDLNYFDLMQLGNLTDKLSGHKSANSKDDIQKIRPVRNAVMHTNEISKAVMFWDDIKDLISVIDKLAP